MTCWSNFSQSMARSTSINKSSRASAQRPRIIFVLRQRFLEALQGVAHSAFHGIFRHSGDRRDVLEREVADFSKKEHLTLLARQGLDAARDALPELLPDHAP